MTVRLITIQPESEQLLTRIWHRLRKTPRTRVRVQVDVMPVGEIALMTAINRQTGHMEITVLDLTGNLAILTWVDTQGEIRKGTQIAAHVTPG